MFKPSWVGRTRTYDHELKRLIDLVAEIIFFYLCFVYAFAFNISISLLMRFLSASVKAIFTSIVPFWVLTPLLSCASSIDNTLACLDFFANVAIVNNLVGEKGVEPLGN